MEDESDKSSRKREVSRKRKRGNDGGRVCTDETGCRRTEIRIKRRENMIIVKTE